MARISSASMVRHWLSPPLLPYPFWARAKGDAARRAAPKVSDFIILALLWRKMNGMERFPCGGRDGRPSYVGVREPWSAGSYHPSQTELAMLSQAWYGRDEGTIHFSLLRNTRQGEVISRIPAHHGSQNLGGGGFSSGESKKGPIARALAVRQKLHPSMARRQEQARRIVAQGNQPCRHMLSKITGRKCWAASHRLASR